MKQKSKCITSILCFLTGLILLVTGCALIYIFKELIHTEVEDGLPLKVNGTSYTAWQEPSTPIYFQVWMFDVTNSQEVLNKGAKPFLHQIGPYTYREHREKFDIVYGKNGTLSYRERKTYNFIREMSAGYENDTFTCINLPMLTVMNMVRYQGKAIKFLLRQALTLTGEKLFTKLSVADLMWGYKDPFLANALVQDALKLLNHTTPPIFGLFAGTNGTDDGVYDIYSGLDHTLDHFAEIISWNGQTKLSYWNSETANAINGSDGTMFPPFIDTNQTKYLFSSDLCRSLGMDYTKGVTNRGIDMDRFVAPETTFGNVNVTPSNAGYCTPPGNCLPSGLLNVSICREGAPVVMSMPHFLGCDPETINAVEGLHPNKEEHSSFIDIEPMAGVVMNAGKRLQINVFIDKIAGFSDTDNFNRLFFPVLWLNESAMLSESDASKFKDQVLDKIKLTDAIKYALIAIGGFIMAIVIVVFIGARMSPKAQTDDRKHLVSGESYDPVQTPSANHIINNRNGMINNGNNTNNGNGFIM